MRVLSALSIVSMASLLASAAGAQNLPPGSYIKSCPDAAMVDGTLIANCKQADGTVRSTTLPDAGRCPEVVNRDGHLTCEQPPSARPRTTEFEGGYATFHDRCGPNEGAPYISIRWRGDINEVMKFTMERGGSIHIQVPRGSTFARGCGGYAPGNAAWAYLRLD